MSDWNKLWEAYEYHNSEGGTGEYNLSRVFDSNMKPSLSQIKWIIRVKTEGDRLQEQLKEKQQQVNLFRNKYIDLVEELENDS